ncbi:MAG: class I SAM-dependent methyltransferase [Desulfobaccales bacterium]
MAESTTASIKTVGRPDCYLCGNKGEPIYANLPDRLFGAPGLWNLKKCPNTACGLIWLDPMPVPEAIAMAYVNYFTHGAPGKSNSFGILKKFLMDTYLSRSLAYPFKNSHWQKTAGLLLTAVPSLRERIARSVAWLPYQPGGRLLDIGCGSGAFLVKMAKLGWQAEGVEVDPAAVAQAHSQGLEVRCGTLEEQRYPESVFDAITMFHVIEHVHEPVELLAECWRLLKKGGRLVVMTPNTTSWGHRIFKENWRELDPPRHLTLFSPDSMRLLAKQAGISTPLIFTRVSMASGIYKTSKAIARIGILNRAPHFNLAARLEGFMFSLLEQWRLSHNAEAGEELIMTGVK